jgi:hypothetical protein
MRTRRWINESMRSTESRAARSARAMRALSVPHAAADIIVPIAGQAPVTGGRGSARQLARLRQRRRLILKFDW